MFHQLSHPGPASTDKIIRHKYVWPSVTKDIANWVKNCLKCQQAKVARNNKFIPARFPLPDARFLHVHLDIIVTLEESEGCTYALTMIDRYSRGSASSQRTGVYCRKCLCQLLGRSRDHIDRSRTAIRVRIFLATS
ncbi:unnamed protein product [Trichogramma brassicae]|uniref:Integrase zinc-binding domain-containing protein n=1 Tax=Trichogramma brassicae TaxID=86971 RepID=A0A6H5ICH5_9HYME|nr:unnamed protein product [Trichogramma brassicae]